MSLKNSVRFLSSAIITAAFIIPSSAFAARTINSLTVTGSPVTVLPGGQVTGAMDVTTVGGSGETNDWESSFIRISTSPSTGGTTTCDNDANITTATANATDTFTINAPTTPGTYNVYFTAFSDNSCTNQSDGPSSVIASVIVSSPEVITATISASDKQYDGTTTATIACSLSGTATANGVTCSSTAPNRNFDDKNIGIGKTVTASNITLSGTYAVGYTLSNTTATTSANINQKSITPQFSASTNSVSKTYDGTSVATVTLGGSTTLTSGGGFIGGDTVSLTFTDAYYGPAGSPNKNIDSPGTQPSDTVTLNGIALAGADAGNYTLSTTTASDTDAGSLTAKPITVTAVTDSRVYNGTTSSLAVPTFTALGTGDTYIPTQTFNNKNVGTNKTLTPSGDVSDGNGGNNYNYTFSNVSTGEITAYEITPTISANNKTYDSTTSATGSCAPAFLFAPDVVTCGFSSLTFDTKHALPAKTVTASGITLGGPNSGNYSTPSSATTTATIDKKTITADFTAPQDVLVKDYDGTDTVTANPTVLNSYMVLAPGSVFFGDEADSVVTSATYADKFVGSSKGITANLALSGADAANYQLTSSTDTDTNAGKINQKAITISAVTDTKVFNGNGTSAENPTAPLPSGETLTAIQEFHPDFTVGTNKVIRIQPISWIIQDSLLVDVTNQYIISTQDATGEILPFPAITISNPNTDPAQSKTITAIHNGVTLSMSADGTGALACDGTRTFVAYASTTFSLESDNGSKVCYRSENALGDFTYSNSNAIAGIDVTVPTITLATTATSPTSANPIPFTATLSENPSGNIFEASDITVTNGSVSNFSGSGMNYTFDVIPSADNVAITVDVATAMFTDAAGNNNSAATQASINYDSSAPSVTITYPSAGYKTNSTTINATFTISGTTIAPISTVECALDSGAFAACDTNSTHSYASLSEGNHTLQVKVTDTALNSSTGTVAIVVDVTDPLITVPASITTEATAATTPVTFTVSFSDNLTGLTSQSCDVTSGFSFPVGTTTVHCEAEDGAGNTSTDSFDVTITDTTGPVFGTLSDVNGQSLSFPVPMTYTSPSTTDLVDGSIVSVCTPASGSGFALGTTVVTCSATDSHANTTTAHFNVNLTQTTSGGGISGSIGGGGPSSVVTTSGGGGGGGSYVPPTNPSNGTDQVSTGQQSTSQTDTGAPISPSSPLATNTGSDNTGNGQVAGVTTFKFTKNMSIGSRISPDVTELQKILIARGFLKIATPTGRFGAQTMQAVKQYQKANSIAQTGTVGPATRAALNSGK